MPSSESYTLVGSEVFLCRVACREATNGVNETIAIVCECHNAVRHASMLPMGEVSKQPLGCRNARTHNWHACSESTLSVLSGNDALLKGVSLYGVIPTSMTAIYDGTASAATGPV